MPIAINKWIVSLLSERSDNKVYIYFGIAKNYELKKNYTKAYQYYKLGNLAKYEMVKNTYFMKDEYSKFDIASPKK